MKFNISESEKKSILKMYGLINEQGTTTPAAPATPAAQTTTGGASRLTQQTVEPRQIGELKIKSQFIQDQNDVNTFLTFSTGNLNDVFTLWYNNANELSPTFAEETKDEFERQRKNALEGKGEYPKYPWSQINRGIYDALKLSIEYNLDPNNEQTKPAFVKALTKYASELSEDKWKLFEVFKTVYNIQKQKLG